MSCLLGTEFDVLRFSPGIRPAAVCWEATQGRCSGSSIYRIGTQFTVTRQAQRGAPYGFSEAIANILSRRGHNARPPSGEWVYSSGHGRLSSAPPPAPRPRAPRRGVAATGDHDIGDGRRPSRGCARGRRRSDRQAGRDAALPRRWGRSDVRPRREPITCGRRLLWLRRPRPLCLGLLAGRRGASGGAPASPARPAVHTT